MPIRINIIHIFLYFAIGSSIYEFVFSSANMLNENLKQPSGFHNRHMSEGAPSFADTYATPRCCHSPKSASHNRRIEYTIYAPSICTFPTTKLNVGWCWCIEPRLAYRGGVLMCIVVLCVYVFVCGMRKTLYDFSLVGLRCFAYRRRKANACKCARKPGGEPGTMACKRIKKKMRINKRTCLS